MFHGRALVVGRLALSNKSCPACGILNDPTSFYCSLCGNKIPSPNTENHNSEASNDNTLILTNTRIVFLTIITFGAYILYWLYLTWKQMDSETENNHYPVWHSLTFLVPIYGLFRLYDHLQSIKTLATKEEIETPFSPVLSLSLIILNFTLAVTSYGVTSGLSILTIEIIQVSLVITALLLAQTTLNSYWQKTKGPDVQSALFERTELWFILILYAIFGLLLSFQPVA